ncbi:uncharacterized protein LOC143449823 [Clavelina lepadiformis]|uniref:uncharacterized protein LOC143449823 n=1 Tax=Clavelina lepadiformis TaxID=159417 RepID=UPI00404118B6
MDQQKSLKDAVKSQEKIEESSVSNCSPNDSKEQLQKNLVVQSGSSTHTEDVSHKSSGRKDLSSISNSVTPNSMGGKSMNTLGSKGRSTHSEDVSNKTSGRKGPSSISNSVTPNSMGGKSMNTLGSKGRSIHSEDVSNKTSGRKGPSSISNSVTPNSMGGKSMNTLGSKGRSTHSEDVSNKTSGRKGPSSISNSVTPSSVGGKSMNTLSSKGGKSTPRSNRQPLPITPIGNCKTCRPTPNLNTSSIHLFDGTTPTIKAPLGTAMSAGSNDDGGHPSANPPQLCMATSVTGLKDYALAYNKDKFRVTLPLGVNSNTTLEELRQKTDVIGSVARRGSDSAFEAVRGKIKKDGAKRFTLPSLQRKRKSYHGEMRADAEEETDANSAGPKPGKFLKLCIRLYKKIPHTL